MWLSVPQLVLYFLPRILILPFVYVAYLFFPCAKCFRYWEAPMNKFLGDIFSYVVFLTVLFVTIVRGSDQAAERVQELGDGCDVVIWIFVISYIWELVKTFYFGGTRAFVRHKWNAYMLTMCLCFLISFIARLSSYIRSHHIFDDDYINESRILWPWDDPMLISEAFYSLGTVFAFGRILYAFQACRTLGPMQLTLSHMMYDTLQMLVIFLVTMLAFASGMTRRYVYYESMVRIDDEGHAQEQPDSFTR